MMNNIIEQQSNFLTTAKQKIIATLQLDRDHDDDSDMEESDATLREKLSQNKEQVGNNIFLGLKKTKVLGPY
jgi:hypothetical protein